MTRNDKKVCDRCGHPAAFYDRIHKQETCDVCVHADHGERMGERWAVAQMLGAAVQTAVALGMSKAQVGAMVAESLDHESRHEPLDISAATLHEESRETREWMRFLTPIGEVA